MYDVATTAWLSPEKPCFVPRLFFWRFFSDQVQNGSQKFYLIFWRKFLFECQNELWCLEKAFFLKFQWSKKSAKGLVRREFKNIEQNIKIMNNEKSWVDWRKWLKDVKADKDQYIGVRSTKLLEDDIFLYFMKAYWKEYNNMFIYKLNKCFSRE